VLIRVPSLVGLRRSFAIRLQLGRKRLDVVIEEVMVEIKAKAALEDVDFVQTLSYLKASGYKVGLLLNLGEEARDQAVGELRVTGSLKH
jgi:GxxExxY protein